MAAHAAQEDDEDPVDKAEYWLDLDRTICELRQRRTNVANALLPLIPPGGEVRTESGTVTRQMIGGQAVLRRT